MRKKPAKRKRRKLIDVPNTSADGLELAMMNRSDVEIIDFNDLQKRPGHHVSGTAADLLRDGHDHPWPWLHNCHAQPDDNKKAVLMGRGYSATPESRMAIERAGVPVMAVNDFPDEFPKPRYWCTGDPANYFGERIWADPGLMKFYPFPFIDAVRPHADAYARKLTPKEAPNTHFFHHVNNDSEPESWLHTPWINWGTTIHGENVPKAYYPEGAARSSMLIGLRLLWHLGYRQVALVGCDCQPHSHIAPAYYRTIFYLLEQIKPTFQRWHYHVYQTNQDSHLRTFDMLGLKEFLARE